jgi:hypothetical protein
VGSPFAFLKEEQVMAGEETIYYKQVLLCEKVLVEKLVSKGRGRGKRLKKVFKWRCRTAMRPINVEEYPGVEITTVKLTVYK